ncbi:MAG: 4'-phosphopantetheinyl transferase superfamily protein, partial [Candidatus Hydrogenedentes bacterium]|nr:4'-phosphopantetheinyl transferase superfamily protein [Candidatus Hydrogenedentota bacterium]
YSKRSVRDRKIAERFFSNGEVKALEEVSCDLKKEAFFNCWTRKEAYIKAKGRGLSISLSSFDVAFAPAEFPTLLRAEGGDAERARWRIHDIQPGGEFVGALVIEARGNVALPTLFEFASSHDR